MRRNKYYTEDQYEQDQREEFVDEEASETEYDELDEDMDERDQFSDELNEELDDLAENDVKYVYKIVDLLQDMIESAAPVRFNAHKRALEDGEWERCLDLLEDLRAAMPSAVKRGAWAYERSEGMRREAEKATKDFMVKENIRFERRMEKIERQMKQREDQAMNRADRIIENAERQAKEMIRQEVIEMGAEEEARQIIADAETKANELMLKTEQACRRLLDGMLGEVGNTLQNLSEMRKKLN